MSLFFFFFLQIILFILVFFPLIVDSSSFLRASRTKVFFRPGDASLRAFEGQMIVFMMQSLRMCSSFFSGTSHFNAEGNPFWVKLGQKSLAVITPAWRHASISRKLLFYPSKQILFIAIAF